MRGAAARRWPRAFAKSAALAVLVVLAPGLASAWGPVGHRAVGAVADQLLSPAAQAAVADLLAEDRDRDGQLSGRHSLAEVSDWADEIRGGPGDHPRWHYDDRPICAGGQGPQSWCARGQCASAQISAMLAVLADEHRSRAERNEALKWVVHLTADLHQPLHAADLAEGGNRIRVASYGRSQERDSASEYGHGRARESESLHAFWDGPLVALALHTRGGVIPARSLQQLLQAARDEDPALVAAGPEQWAAESNELARSFALNIEGIGCDPVQDPGATRTVRLSRAYVTHAKVVVEDRLALAGARLARVLNEALK